MLIELEVQEDASTTSPIYVLYLMQCMQKPNWQVCQPVHLLTHKLTSTLTH